MCRTNIFCLINFILLPLFSFSQARYNIFNGAYTVMGGGSSSSPVYMVIENANANAISRTGIGHIISENEYNKVKWEVGTNTGIYQIPLGKGTTDYMPFYFNKTTAGTCPGAPCSYAVSSYYTLNNAVFPSGVTNIIPGENSAIDRFWVVNLSGYTSNPTSDVRFYYIDNPTELDGIAETDLQAQHWNSSSLSWDLPVGTVDATNNYVEVTGVSQFSPWTLVDKNNPLPIQLLSFTAQWENTQHNAALLKWTTAGEINNNYFNVERSNDGVVFEKTGNIIYGAGNSSTIKNYSLIDAEIPYTPDVFYYRLKQVDYNGQYSYSKAVALSRTNNATIITMFPNPASKFVNISLKASDESAAAITIVNSLSQIVWNKESIMQRGINKFPVDISLLAKGVYTVKITQNNNSSVHKLIIN